ncbi:MAG: NUDIX domain-containing protein [Lachnospiraceae bacterium]|nr:NUDIX domain-containing protein [Lachnospiraceae bacterium]
MRNRSMALVVQDEKILMVQALRRGRLFWELPGGGIEAGETPEDVALRELQEECGLSGVVNRLLNTLHCRDGSIEYVFLVDVSEEQKETVGGDPEATEQTIKNVSWKKLTELSERDRAFLWSRGLVEVDDFFELAWSWGDEISYPIG